MSGGSVWATLTIGLGALMLAGAASAEPCYDRSYQGVGQFGIWSYQREDLPPERLEARWYSGFLSDRAKASLMVRFDVTGGSMGAADRLVISILAPRAYFPKDPKQFLKGPKHDLYVKLAIGDAKPLRVKASFMLEGISDEVRSIVGGAEIKPEQGPDLFELSTRADRAELTLETAGGRALVSGRVQLPGPSEWAAMRKDAAEAVSKFRSATSCELPTFTWDAEHKRWAPPPPRLVVHAPPPAKP
jgi:hypothetical protein